MFFYLRAYHGAAMPPLDIFLSTFAAVGGRGGAAMPPLVFFSAVLAATGRRLGVPPWPPLCLCTPFSSLAQFCKKPCNPVFNILQKS